MNVYAPLQSYLADREETSVVMTYKEIEALLGRKLPPTAYGAHKRQWWANTETHSQALAWLRAKRKARLDVNHDRVTFVSDTASLAPSTVRPTDATVELRLEGLNSAAKRMLEDIAEEKGMSPEDAVVTLLNQSALQRRAATLDWFAANTATSKTSSVDLIRADRDGR